MEDDQSLRELTIIVLKKAGYTTLEAKDGLTAFALAQQYKEPIHLLVTDVIMPGMNGGELATKLKELRPNVAVLFVSGYTANLISDQELLTSCEFLLQKPSLNVRCSILCELLLRILAWRTLSIHSATRM